jgi:hypothetical protein
MLQKNKGMHVKTVACTLEQGPAHANQVHACEKQVQACGEHGHACEKQVDSHDKFIIAGL